MKAKVTFALILVGAALAVTVAILLPPNQPVRPELQPPGTASSPIPPDPPQIPEPVFTPRPVAAPASKITAISAPAEQPPASTNKLERLTKIRESFRALAAGDPASALRAAKQISD